MPAWLIVFLVTIGYLLASLAIGLASGRHASDSTEGYVAGDRSLNFLVLYFIMGASVFSAFAFLGGPGWAYSRGAAAFYILAYASVGLVPWYFFGPRVAALGRRFGYVTQAELFAHRFDSRAIPAILAVLSVFAFVPYLVIQMKGAGYVFNVVTEGRVPQWAGSAIAYGVVLIYVFRSGVLGVGWTNTFQGMFMMVLAWGLGLYLPAKLHGGVGPMFDAIAAGLPDMLRGPGLGADGQPWSWGAYSSSVAISAFGFSVWPHYFMKIYTARDVDTLKRTVVYYPTFALFLVPILFIGFSGVLAFPGVEPADAILPTIVTSAQIGLPPLIVGLFCAGALAASMSTGDALLHAAGSVAVRDFWGNLRPGALDDAAQRRWIRHMVILVGAVSYGLALIPGLSLVELLLLSYGFIAQLFPLTVVTFLWRGVTRAGALWGLVAGGGIAFFLDVALRLDLVSAAATAGVHPGIYGMVGNVIVMIAVSRHTARLAPAHVAEFIDSPG
ncbi:sodium:solute symporter family protein [Candidatus Palauibacter sp.]|uniref:sodium:solute symporter family protein n=1 Tax=Candidatus Palauibacter sp. TaxID=3101350 RepID=UPI003B5AA8B5